MSERTAARLAEDIEVEFVRALRALRLELPAAVHDDFAAKARAYMLGQAAELRRVTDALREAHERTGACPLCEAGPPPYHSPACALASLDADQPPGDA